MYGQIWNRFAVAEIILFMSNLRLTEKQYWIEFLNSIFIKKKDLSSYLLAELFSIAAARVLFDSD